MIVSVRDSLPLASRIDCLVTGATGLVGNNVVRLLCNRDHNVRVLVRPGQLSGPAADARQAAGGACAALPIDMVAAGLHDDVAMQRAVDGTTHVIHSAAMVHCGWRHLAEMRHVNVEGTRHVLDAAASVGARRVVRISSATVYGAWANNPVPLTEDTALRPNPDFSPAVQAAEVERLLAEWRGSSFAAGGGGHVGVDFRVQSSAVISSLKFTIRIGAEGSTSRRLQLVVNCL
jgi:nucleoside-diphosphate-sugar epimerase